MARFRIGRGGRAGGVSGDALVLASDSGFSALSWWTATASLCVTVGSQAPFHATTRCRVHRDKGLLAGTWLPVSIDPDDRRQVEIRWHEVPTIEQRIARGDPAILDPEGTWYAVTDARIQVESPPASGIWRSEPGTPPWGDGRIVGWPPPGALDDGRRPGIALVVSRSEDPGGYRSLNDWSLPCQPCAGTIYDGLHDYLGWLLLCVIPESGVRYGLHVRKRLRRDHLGAVLPVAIRPKKAHDIEIPWRFAPNTTHAASERLRVANRSALEAVDQRAAASSGAAEAALAKITDPVAHSRTQDMLKNFGLMSGASAPVRETSAAGPDGAAALARLRRLHAEGILTDDEYAAERARFGPGATTE